jgi:2-oxoglutarate/2-oxoacid ferredoxin oxidoreductase subunit alpha
MPNRVLTSGNEALAEGALRAGCDAYFGYPITPQNELITYMAVHMPQLNRAYVQAESEIAAINMVFGAAATGKRAMTSSSSPGISLKQEGISYLAGAELPALIVNVQRAGPGLGSIEPAQADYWQATRGGGHGDYRLIVLAPYSAQEMHDFAALAFDLADKYRTPVMILADGQLGQTMEPVNLRESFPEPPEKPWALTGAKDRPQNIIRSYLPRAGLLEVHNKHLQAKFAEIQDNEVRFQDHDLRDARIMVIAYGTSARLGSGAIGLARQEGIEAGMLRPITLWPFPSEAIASCLDRVEAVLVVELSAGQMLDDVRLAVNGRRPVYFLGRVGGGVPSIGDVLQKIREIAEGL